MIVGILRTPETWIDVGIWCYMTFCEPRSATPSMLDRCVSCDLVRVFYAPKRTRVREFGHKRHEINTNNHQASSQFIEQRTALCHPLSIFSRFSVFTFGMKIRSTSLSVSISSRFFQKPTARPAI